MRNDYIKERLIAGLIIAAIVGIIYATTELIKWLK